MILFSLPGFVLSVWITRPTACSRGECQTPVQAFGTLEEVEAPRTKVHVQAVALDLRRFAIVMCSRQGVAQYPGSGLIICPRHVYPPLSGAIAQVHDYKPSFIVYNPCPGDQVLEAWVVPPAFTAAETPPSRLKCPALDRFQELAVEPSQLDLLAFLGAPRQEHGHFDSAPFQLSFMEQPGSGKSGHHHGG